MSGITTAALIGGGLAGAGTLGAAAIQAGSQKSPVSWESQLSGPQQQTLGSLGQYFQQLNPQSFNYSGQLTAPINAGQQQVVGQMGQLGQEANQTYANIGQYDPNTINQQFNSDIEQPAMANWQQNIAPYLRESMPAFSSEQGNVLSRSALTEQNNLDQMRMGYQQGQEQIAGNALTQGAAFNQANMAIQSVPQEIQQAGLTNSYNAFVQSNTQYQQSVNQMLGYLGIQSQAAVQNPNLAQTAVAGIGAGANLGINAVGAQSNANLNNAYINALNGQQGLPSTPAAGQIDPSSSDQLQQAYTAMQNSQYAGF